MNIFNDDDPLGLRKLDREFTKMFKSEKINPGPKYRQSKPGQKKQVSNVDIAKAAFKYSKDIIKFLYSLATRNNIPKTHEEIIAMRDRLKLEEKLKIESNQAIQEIREFQARGKQIRKLERQVAIERIKRKLKFLHYLKTHPRALILVLFGGTAIIVLFMGIVFPR